MKNITVSVDERNASSRPDPGGGVGGVRIGARARLPERTGEPPRARRRRIMDEVFEDIRATRSGFSSSENVPREALYQRRERRAVR